MSPSWRSAAHCGQVYRYLRRRTGDHHRAEANPV
jgi:hypothetical protein